MNPIGRCESCTHWKRYAEAHPNAPRLASKAEVVGGICKSPKFVEDAEYGLDMLVYSYREGGEFWTGPQFGCIHWARAEAMKIAPLSAEVESVLAYAENCVDSDPTARGIKCLAVEVRRLRACLEKSNSNHEHFEREWYLRGDEIERLRAELAAARADYGYIVTKFDACRAALAFRYKADTGNDPTPPDEYEGTWHEWLIEQSDKAALKP